MILISLQAFLTSLFLYYANKSIYCVKCIQTSLSNSQLILVEGTLRKVYV